MTNQGNYHPQGGSQYSQGGGQYYQQGYGYGTGQPPPGNNGGGNSGCLKYGAIIAAIFVGIISLIFITIAIFAIAAGDDGESYEGGDVDVTQEDGGTGINGSSDGGDKKAKSNKKGVLSVGETYTTGDGLKITVTDTKAKTGAFDEKLNCAVVNYVNTSSDEEFDFNGYWDWKTQGPSGAILDPEYDDKMLDSGQLAPGGRVSGQICSKKGKSGSYKFIYEPSLSFDDEKATWEAKF